MSMIKVTRPFIATRLFVALLVVAGLDAGSVAFAQSLPSGWSSSDIGAVGAAGTASGSGGSFTVEGAGADIWGSADAFHFVYQSLTGDGSIVTRVVSEEAVDPWTKGGVMMRETLSAGSKHASMFVTPGKGLAFQRRTSTGGASANTSGGSGSARWVGMKRTGNTFAAYISTDGSSWSLVGSATISMSSTIYVGLPVSSHVAGTLATVSFASTDVTSGTSSGGTTTTETLVFMRHGEKPSAGLGQITCQGLQRALELPTVLINRYGSPKYIFAPNPIPKVTESSGGSYYYVRPLATIEPTAIRLGLPVNAQYGFTDITGLQTELLSSTYASSTVFIAWEHLKLQEVVQNIMDAFNSTVTVPAWASGDFDSLYVVEISRSNGSATATFRHEFEGLNNLPTTCP